MNFATREMIRDHLKNNKNEKIFPLMETAFDEALYTPLPYFVVLYNHVTRQYFIALTKSFSSYIGNVFRMFRTHRRGGMPDGIWDAYRASDQNDWSVEVYECNKVNTYEWLQEAIANKGFKELSANSSKHRNSNRDHVMFKYTDLESGYFRYVSSRTQSRITALVGARNAIASMKYRYWNRNVTTTTKMRNLIGRICDNTHNRKAYTLEIIPDSDIPLELSDLTGSAQSRTMNERSLVIWLNSDYVANALNNTQAA